MNSYKLSFAEVTIVTPFIAEINIDNGIEVNVNHVEEYHSFLRSHFDTSFGVLVNQKNSYSYDFLAQVKINTLKEIRAIAIITYNQFSAMTSKSLISLPRKCQWNAQIFFNYSIGLNWLTNEINSENNIL